MSTILEGLNKLSGALGGAETATENLDALNAIAGALGGETNATNNADAIDQIAEHASGGGGSSDFSTAEVYYNNKKTTFTAYFPTGYYDEYQGEVTAYSTSMQTISGGNAHDTYQVILYKGACLADFTNATGSISITGDATNNGGYITITGDCTITIN